MCGWFQQRKVITFESLLCEAAICRWHAKTFEGAQLVLCRRWLGFFPLLSILTVEEANWSCRHRGPGVRPWLIVALWPYLDFPAKDSRHFPSPQQNRACLGGRTFETPIHRSLPSPPLLPFSTLPSWPPGTMLPGCIRTDPKSVPFLDIAKYSPVLTDLMATTPTLTDRISIRPGK